MKDIFDIKRFTNFFVYELRRSWNEIGLTATITGLLPLFAFALEEALSRITTGAWAQEMGLKGLQLGAFIFILCEIILVFPTKLYGNLTEKRYATDYLTLPVSAFEKWLSIAGMCFIVIPAFMGGLAFGSDALLSSLVHSYGNPATSMLSEWSEYLTEESKGILSIDLHVSLYTSICQWFLLFTLGAICFKKSKAAKTILVCLAVSAVFSSILISSIKDSSLMALMNGNFSSTINFWSNLQSILLYVILLGGIYARIKTLKQ